jgi:HEAT repeat protein
MAVYYAAIGIIGGVGQLIGGRLLDAFADIEGQLAFITLDPYTPLMIGGIVLPLLSIILFRRVKADGALSVTEFAGMFVQGNPIYALETMLRYYHARDERAAVFLTERMGQAHSPLTVDELLEALEDPRFNVRYEAVISIARTKPHPRLTEALAEMVGGTELSLSNVAAWALGRVGDDSALPALRAGLDSHYRSVQAHCARAIGTLHDDEAVPVLQRRLEDETDKGLQMAFAYALGLLQAKDAIPRIFDLMWSFENEGARLELALSLARMTGKEQHFVRLLRQMRGDAGTAVAQELLHLKHRLAKHDGIEGLLSDCADTFAREDLAAGVALLMELLRALPNGDSVRARLLKGCAAGLEHYGTERMEYLVLALHVLHVT